MGRAQREQPLGLAAGVGSHQIEALPVPSVFGFDRWAAPGDLGAAERRLHRGLLVLIPYQGPVQCVAPEQADVACSVAGDLAEIARSGQEAVARPDHAECVSIRISQHDVVGVGFLAHVKVAAADETQRRFYGPLLVLGAVAGQVQVQPSRAELLGVGGDEPEPDLPVLTRDQRPAGLREDLTVEQFGPDAATTDTSATSNVTACSRKAIPAP